MTSFINQQVALCLLFQYYWCEEKYWKNKRLSILHIQHGYPHQTVSSMARLAKMNYSNFFENRTDGLPTQFFPFSITLVPI